MAHVQLCRLSAVKSTVQWNRQHFSWHISQYLKPSRDQKRAFELSTEATYLGITVDFKLSWATHINIYKKCEQVLMENDSSDTFSSTESLARMMKFTLNTMFQTQMMIRRDTEETRQISRRVDKLENEIRTLDQYGRKYVMILTGLKQEDPENETEDELVGNVLENLHFVNPNLNHSYKDFSAIHRKGRKGKNGKPPISDS